ERAHERQGHVRDVQIRLRVSAKAQNFQTKLVAAGFGFAAEISTALEGPQNVASRAFGNGELATDFGIGEALAAMGDVFENVESAFDGGCRTRICTCHG